MKLPFFRPSLTEAEITEVVGCLRSGWLTTGPLTRRFEENFAAAVVLGMRGGGQLLHGGPAPGGRSLGLAAGQAGAVPTMTFAATAEVVR